jgi:transcriptional regulator GlxA family with amidase domain
MQIAIALYPGFTALDAIGPYNVFANLPGAEVVLVAEHAGRLDDDNGLLHIDVEHTLADVPAPDVLLVPGGLITRRLAAAGGPLIEWVRSAHEHTTWTTSVCTGALVLGAAGVLQGRTAVTHWHAAPHLAAYGATATEQRVVFDGKVVTAAGVSAGIDLALTLVGRMAGDEVAQAIQLGIEYDPQPPYDAGAPSKAPAPILELVGALMSQAEADLVPAGHQAPTGPTA